MWLGFRDLNLAELGRVIRGLEPGWIIAAIVVYQIAAYIITWRWYFLLRPVRDIPANRLFPVVMIGYMGNNIYPARIGELLRAFVLKRKVGLPYAPSLATIIVERIFDGLVMLIFIFIALLFVEIDEPFINTAIWGAHAFVFRRFGGLFCAGATPGPSASGLFYAHPTALSGAARSALAGDC
ncbi:MAG: flippase-like domain-containing protein [Anaerolineae bacterium]|nr:flippase-like domain-containing protein [Anaerolineae bacterium]